MTVARRRARAGAALIALALAAGSCGGSAPAVQPTTPALPALWYDDATFQTSVRAAETLPLPAGDVEGAIIPHDWAGGRYIAGLFRGLARGDPPATVILIGPNHDNEGGPGTLTTALGWGTPSGTVRPDGARIDALLSEGLATTDDAVLVTEHSVAGIMPAIAYYLPDARVVPLIIRGDVSPEETARLGEALAGLMDDRTVLVAAVDFSHDLVSRVAEQRNAMTLSIVRGGDSARLFTLDNQYLDSPASIAVLMRAMALREAAPFVLTADTNSAALHQDEFAPTTSYLVGYYPAGGGSGRTGP